MAQNDGMRGPSPHPDYDDGDLRYPEPAVSDILRHVREDLGHDLRDVSKELRIRYDYLLAIEDGRYHDLPGATYAIGFVRSYAEYLGLDSDGMVQRFKTEVRDLAAGSQDLSFPAPKPEGRMPGVALILISVLLIALVYGAWYIWNDQGRPYVELLPGVSDQESTPDDTQTATGMQEGTAFPDDAASDGTVEPMEEEMSSSTETATRDPEESSATSQLTEAEPSEVTDGEESADAVPTPDEGAEGTAANDGDETLPQTSAPAEEGTAQTDQPENDTFAETGSEASGEDNEIPELPGEEEEATESMEPDTGSGRVYGEENEGARIVLEATADSWVQIRDAEGELVFTRVLRAGESYLVPDEEGMTLLTGNAGGLDIHVDDSVIPPLGGMGTVRRDIPLDPQQLSSGTLQQ